MSHHYPGLNQLMPINYSQSPGFFQNYGQYPMMPFNNITVRRRPQQIPFPNNTNFGKNTRKYHQPKPKPSQPPQEKVLGSSLDKYTKAIEASVQFSQTEECSPAAKTVISLLAGLLQTATQQIHTSAHDPVEEHRRQRSVVLANVPESVSPSAQTRVNEDNQAVMEILDELDIEARPLTVFRMGKMDGKTPRLLKVELPTRGHTQRTIQSKAKLQKSTRYASVRVRASLSKEDRDRRHELIAKCTDMRAKDQENKYDFIIWRNEVIARNDIPDRLANEKSTVERF
ncbi:hypothetical protein Ddc_24503 [Ditylenchus destructor]|nr:hypothetical protein Ddc_24503 [Ditylenchus destructor]